MIEKNKNVLYDSKIKRIIEYEDLERITILDQRFYKRGDKFYPSVTSILSYFPKDRFFEDWMKSVGHNADFIASKAADEGSQVHEAIEKILKNERVTWIEKDGKVNYDLEVWEMILKFVNFWKTYKPKLVTSECHIFSDEYEYAGTIDLVIEMGGEYWLIDIKTSNSLYTSMELQLAAYINAWNETYDKKINKGGILWLKAATRGPQKDKIQGKGWQLKMYNIIEDNTFDLFKNVYNIYKNKNPNAVPYSELYPTSISLDD